MVSNMESLFIVSRRFAKFKDQPLSDIDPEALDITKDNIPVFREVIKELGISNSFQKALLNDLDKIETQLD